MFVDIWLCRSMRSRLINGGVAAQTNDDDEHDVVAAHQFADDAYP